MKNTNTEETGQKCSATCSHAIYAMEGMFYCDLCNTVIIENWESVYDKCLCPEDIAPKDNLIKFPSKLESTLMDIMKYNESESK